MRFVAEDTDITQWIYRKIVCRPKQMAVVYGKPIQESKICILGNPIQGGIRATENCIGKPNTRMEGWKSNVDE
jgi:hypothetical protein